MKKLKELTLLDKFLFDETMDVPEAHEAMLRIILGDDNLRLLFPSQTEKEIRTASWLKSIRLDVFAVDEQGTVYDTEMQASRKNDLERRSRYYQSLIDSSLLEPGKETASYNLLNNSYIIMICPFDLFGDGRYCYTFVPRCEENPAIKLKDGAVRIFLNTRGMNDTEISAELRDFLHYIETADESLAENSQSSHLKKLHACVSQIKDSEKVGVRYMQKWEEKWEWKNQGLEEGKDLMLFQSLGNLMKTTGCTPEKAMDLLMVPAEERERYARLLEETEEN